MPILFIIRAIKDEPRRGKGLNGVIVDKIIDAARAFLSGTASWPENGGIAPLSMRVMKNRP